MKKMFILFFCNRLLVCDYILHLENETELQDIDMLPFLFKVHLCLFKCIKEKRKKASEGCKK